MEQVNTLKRWGLTSLSILWMGLGQFVTGEYAKGLILAVFQGFVVLFCLTPLRQAWWGLITLGTEPGRDHSIFLLAQGLLGLILTVLLLLLYIGNIKDAHTQAKRYLAGQKALPFREMLRSFWIHAEAYLWLAPGTLLVIFVALFPVFFGMSLGFTSYDLFNSPPAKLVEWVGLHNFVDLFSIKSWRGTMMSVLRWNIVWAVVSTITAFVAGFGVALLMNREDIRFRAFFRTAFILPWAMPSFISALVWTGLFNTTFGPINEVLGMLGVSPIPWLSNAMWARIALFVVNIWMGFPFQMVLCLGILQAIPKELYEAAWVDGATDRQSFRYITLPSVLYSVAPLLILQLAGNFNNFGLIYLLTGGGPTVFGNRGAGATDLLISWMYKLTFNLSKFNYAAAVGIMIFIPVAIISVYNLRQTRSFKEG
ncbi:MAG: sugar ABC transporter permease [Firmicutes bacterium]|nr:sugar ABC transporter permease [Bacillota bacterium]